jgi:hypothetical protein
LYRAFAIKVIEAILAEELEHLRGGDRKLSVNSRSSALKLLIVARLNRYVRVSVECGSHKFGCESGGRFDRREVRNSWVSMLTGLGIAGPSRTGADEQRQRSIRVLALAQLCESFGSAKCSRNGLFAHGESTAAFEAAAKEKCGVAGAGAEAVGEGSAGGLGNGDTDGAVLSGEEFAESWSRLLRQKHCFGGGDAARAGEAVLERDLHFTACSAIAALTTLPGANHCFTCRTRTGLSLV